MLQTFSTLKEIESPQYYRFLELGASSTCLTRLGDFLFGRLLFAISLGLTADPWLTRLPLLLTLPRFASLRLSTNLKAGFFTIGLIVVA